MFCQLIWRFFIDFFSKITYDSRKVGVLSPHSTVLGHIIQILYQKRTKAEGLMKWTDKT